MGDKWRFSEVRIFRHRVVSHGHSRQALGAETASVPYPEGRRGRTWNSEVDGHLVPTAKPDPPGARVTGRTHGDSVAGGVGQDIAVLRSPVARKQKGTELTGTNRNPPAEGTVGQGRGRLCMRAENRSARGRRRLDFDELVPNLMLRKPRVNPR